MAREVGQGSQSEMLPQSYSRPELTPPPTASAPSEEYRISAPPLAPGLATGGQLSHWGEWGHCLTTPTPNRMGIHMKQGRGGRGGVQNMCLELGLGKVAKKLEAQLAERKMRETITSKGLQGVERGPRIMGTKPLGRWVNPGATSLSLFSPL